VDKISASAETADRGDAKSTTDACAVMKNTQCHSTREQIIEHHNARIFYIQVTQISSFV